MRANSLSLSSAGRRCCKMASREERTRVSGPHLCAQQRSATPHSFTDLTMSEKPVDALSKQTRVACCRLYCVCRYEPNESAETRRGGASHCGRSSVAAKAAIAAAAAAYRRATRRTIDRSSISPRLSHLAAAANDSKLLLIDARARAGHNGARVCRAPPIVLCARACVSRALIQRARSAARE